MWRFPGVWRCARGGFRHAESESEVKNDGKQPPHVKQDENKNLKQLILPDIDLIGDSNFIIQSRKKIIEFSKTNSRLLIEGNFGVGKKILANQKMEL